MSFNEAVFCTFLLVMISVMALAIIEPKKCRKLIPKKRRSVWVAYHKIKQIQATKYYTNLVFYVEPTGEVLKDYPDYHFVEFREV